MSHEPRQGLDPPWHPPVLYSLNAVKPANDVKSNDNPGKKLAIKCGIMARSCCWHAQGKESALQQSYRSESMLDFKRPNAQNKTGIIDNFRGGGALCCGRDEPMRGWRE